jgi:hypothetical protein
MSGTDNEVTEQTYRNHFRRRDTGDENFDDWGYPGRNAGKSMEWNCLARSWRKYII